MISDRQLDELGPAARADLARRLAAFPPPVRTLAQERARLRFIVVAAIASVVMIPWIAILAATLPPRYLAGHWRVTWVGFDLVLGAALAVTAWAALRRRRIVILAAAVSGSLLASDAWFDIMTASGPERWVSIATGVFVELPLAGWLFFVAHHLVKRRA
ncbi:hypothetical protein KZZ52_38585 [Dactylosporangium sp. AC04546]|uniref:hypothetical protein n=1 Tax=Dactylosporangium sp. AC04546 TaxID=2862460 RepID=UPI001EDF3CE2|nr:hypothetical protein [Dactylosporangium sp. AC04546]WVK79864.1 hypothetical protein KZZ52_38585 [Dactylosporangium sp. AC04546]